MSVANMIEEITIPEESFWEVANKLTTFYDLYAALDICRTPVDALTLLKIEVLSKNRPSYKNRIISRYSKLRMHQDKREIEAWALKKGK